MATITVHGADFGYDEAGEGPAVVLLHAAVGDRRMWDAQFTALAQDHRVIRYDRRGFGESTGGSDAFFHHEDLLALLDAWGIERAALVGSSMGGACALDAALAAPERITRVALLGSGLSGHEWPPHMQADLASLTRDVDLTDPAAMAEINLRYLVVGPDRTPDVLPPGMWELAMTMCELVYTRESLAPQWTRFPETRHRLGEITTPALVLIGLSDALGLIELSAHLAESLPNATRVDLPDTGHLPQLERPDEVTTIVAKFLGEGLVSGK